MFDPELINDEVKVFFLVKWSSEVEAGWKKIGFVEEVEDATNC